ncbi:MAG: 5'-methylthioadenosine/adenosylhomocysteine nucleosidase [Campylobacterales bacterium]
MIIGLLGAMREEIEPLLEAVGSYQLIEYAGNKFYFAKRNVHDLVIAYSKIGKVNAALTATLLLEKFGAQLILFSGVAGGINPSLNIGDLVVATKLVQHDVDLTPFGHPWGFIPESGDFYETDVRLRDIADDAAKELGLTLLKGVIATGDQFVADEAKKRWIGATYGADALEMEGASVAAVCTLMGRPCFVLRSISDKAGESAAIDFDAFLVDASKRSAALILAMVDRL